MPTISAGASATITLAQGTRIKVSSGSGIAVLGPGPQSGQQFALGLNGAVGPFPRDQVVYVTALAALDYAIDPQDPSKTDPYIGVGGTLFDPRDQLPIVSENPSTRAYLAWLSQPKTYTLAAVPAPTHYIDSIRGSDANAGTSPALAWQTLAKLQTALPAAGSVIALANDSVFNQTDRVSFSGATALNGTNEATRLTFTNYDPGGVPLQRPRIRFRYLPTNVQWTWDATSGSWYYTNPNGRNFSRDALGRFGGQWGSQKSVNGQALVPGLLIANGDMYADDTNKRMYVYAPAGTDPTTYYGGAGSVILGEGEGAALSFNRCGNFITFDNIIFEECGLGLSFANTTAVANISGIVVQRCTFLNCGRAMQNLTDSSGWTYTMTSKFVQNTAIGIGSSVVHFINKPANSEVAGNYMRNVGESMSAGGAVYAQEPNGGLTTNLGNVIYENYIESAKHNRGLSPFDGSCLYMEVRAKSFFITRNTMTKSHHGVYNNSGNPQTVTHNIFDDVDIPYVVSDANSIGATNSTFIYNTIVNCALTKYRTPGARDNVEHPIYVNDNISTGKTLDHRNNVISLAPGVAARASQRIRTTSVYDASSNYLSGMFTYPVIVEFNNVLNSTPTPVGTQFGDAKFGANYALVNSGVNSGAALAAYPVPNDFWNLRGNLPLIGAVSVPG